MLNSKYHKLENKFPFFSQIKSEAIEDKDKTEQPGIIKKEGLKVGVDYKTIINSIVASHDQEFKKIDKNIKNIMSMAHYNSTALFTKLSELLHYNYTLLSGNKVGNMKNLPKINTLNNVTFMMEETLFRNTQVHQPESTVFPWFCQCFCQYGSRSKMLSFFISMFMTLFWEKDSSCFPTILNDVSVKQLCCPCCVSSFLLPSSFSS